MKLLAMLSLVFQINACFHHVFSSVFDIVLALFSQRNNSIFTLLVSALESVLFTGCFIEYFEVVLVISIYLYRHSSLYYSRHL